MKTSEFIERVLEVEGVGSHKERGSYVHFITRDGSMLASVFVKRTHAFDTAWTSFHELKKQSKDRLLTLIYEYAKTPLEEREEREEPKKYKLKHKLVEDTYLNYYFGYIKVENKLRFSNSHETGSFKTVFTIQEWESLTEQTWEDLLLQFKAIEV